MKLVSIAISKRKGTGKAPAHRVASMCSFDKSFVTASVDRQTNPTA
jgi:hypothetical protein